jgi:uncharacterized cupin superfamily protein
MPKISLADVPELSGTGYPAPFAAAVAGRLYRRLGAAAGLSQYGVNLVTLKPGAWASQRHWHEKEDEFAIVLSGTLVLVEDGGETPLKPGDCAAWKAGAPNGHHLVNRSASDATFLVVGTSMPGEKAHYPDIDLAFVDDENGKRFTHKDGTPYQAP